MAGVGRTAGEIRLLGRAVGSAGASWDFLPWKENWDLVAAEPIFIAVKDGTRSPRGRFSESKMAIVILERGKKRSLQKKKDTNDGVEEDQSAPAENERKRGVRGEMSEQAYRSGAESRWR